jgi:hypothetical protein
MALDCTVYADTGRFLSSVKTNVNDDVLRAVSELDRHTLSALIDKKMAYKGLEVRNKKGRMLFIGILLDADELHRDGRGRFHEMPLFLYAIASPPKSLKLHATLWAENLVVQARVKHLIKAQRFRNAEWERGLEQEAQQAAQNAVPHPPAPAAGMWANAQPKRAVGQGSLLTFSPIGEHKGEVDDDYRFGGISLE